MNFAQLDTISLNKSLWFADKGALKVRKILKGAIFLSDKETSWETEMLSRH